MDFQVSARKWRPQKFSELVGQEAIVRTLSNAIRIGRVSHAYLFSGTRGVGKTTTARIFAKALNCVDGPTPEPCDRCAFCVEIREGRNVDVLEIDGASNTGVADVRDIIENIRYATSACRYKVYIIDEVHMLSKSAFNALLKTLEEPPPKVVFVFATTEQNKIPETILSRCQRFDFKPLSRKQIILQMEAICKHEGIKIDEASLETIAKNGAGSMRDAQSLLDQAVAFCGKEVAAAAVESALGIVGQEVLETFVDFLARRDAEALVGLIQEIANDGKDLCLFCRDLIEYFRNLLVAAIAKKPESLINVHTCNLEGLKKQAKVFGLDELQQMFRVLSRAETEMKHSSLPRIVFEMAVLRLTDARPFRDIDEMIRKINRLESEAGLGEAPPFDAGHPEYTETVKKNSRALDEKPSPPGEDCEPGAERSAEPSTTVRDEQAGVAGIASVWGRIKEEICDKKRHFIHFLAESAVTELGPQTIRIEFPDPYTLGLVEKEENLEIIRNAVKSVCNYGGVEVKLCVKTSGAAPRSEETTQSEASNNEEKKQSGDYNKPKSKSEAEIIQDALDIFGGVVVR